VSKERQNTTCFPPDRPLVAFLKSSCQSVQKLLDLSYLAE
jgi:hypothetical protein